MANIGFVKDWSILPPPYELTFNVKLDPLNSKIIKLLYINIYHAMIMYY